MSTDTNATLEANPESLLLKKGEDSVHADPFHSRLAAAFDEGGAKGMMSVTLPIQRGCVAMLDSSCKPDQSDAFSAHTSR